MKIEVTLPGYYIVENGVTRKVTKEEIEEYEKTHDFDVPILITEEKKNGTDTQNTTAGT